jgi:hypothetical protein
MEIPRNNKNQSSIGKVSFFNVSPIKLFRRIDTDDKTFWILPDKQHVNQISGFSDVKANQMQTYLTNNLQAHTKFELNP